MSSRAAYFAFDRFPTTKGASVHIGHMVSAMTDFYGPTLLGVLAGGLPAYQREKSVEIVRFDGPETNLIDRAQAFSSWVATRLVPHLETLEMVQVRDPWSALPVLSAPGRHYRVIYEANGLPSIELPQTWPRAAPATIAKIRQLETFCLTTADVVVVPSAVIGRAVAGRGVPQHRIHLLPNGSELPKLPLPRPAEAPADYLVYVGALQHWQGIDVLLRAYARLADLTELRLVICSSVPERRARPLRRLAERLAVADRIDWQFLVDHRDIPGWLAHARLAVAPLTGCARNVEQGCSPLKILESMAAGTPVVASDLPAVRELMTDGVHGRLVPPDRPAELARAIRVLLEYPGKTAAMGRAGSLRVAEHFTWDQAKDGLAEVYRKVAGD